jgi:Uri superfamily endonuclease
MQHACCNSVIIIITRETQPCAHCHRVVDMSFCAACELAAVLSTTVLAVKGGFGSTDLQSTTESKSKKCLPLMVFT